VTMCVCVCVCIHIWTQETRSCRTWRTVCNG